jgi:capsular exopolysaccharide synthesis family protein
MERGPGLADVLREGYDVHKVIRPTRVENLWIISSGRVPPNPSELIGSERMRKLLEQLKNEFDLVICDAPSMLVVTDPVLLSTEVDTVVHVVSADHARRETVIRGKKLLETARAHIAGVVLNNLKATRRHYYYYYYYYDDDAAQKPKRWYYL